VRMGDVGSGLWVVLGAGVLQLGVRGFALTNVVLAVVWLALAWSIVKEQRRLATAALAEAAPADVIRAEAPAA
jgi:hypothetical protein